MDLPVFAIHSVLFPGERTGLRVFEPRYLRMMDAVLPGEPFVVAAIERGSEVGGPADPHPVGVTATVRTHDLLDDGTIELEVVGRERVRLLGLRSADPYPVWATQPFPDEGGAGTEDVERAAVAFARFLRATGLTEELPAVPREPVVASYALAAAVPALVPTRQRLLATPGAGERLRLVRDTFSMEARLISTLHAGVGGADPAVNLN